MLNAERFVWVQDDVKGTVYDQKTNLSWAPIDNGEDIAWRAAQEYCQVGEWRAPTIGELITLLADDVQSGRDHGRWMATDLIRPSGLLWSSSTEEAGPGRAWYIDPNTGYQGNCRRSENQRFRVLAVREGADVGVRPEYRTIRGGRYWPARPIIAGRRFK